MTPWSPTRINLRRNLFDTSDVPDDGGSRMERRAGALTLIAVLAYLLVLRQRDHHHPEWLIRSVPG
jgi:hypothetical protein